MTPPFFCSPLRCLALLAVVVSPCACGSSSGTPSGPATGAGADAPTDAASTTPYVPKGVTIGDSDVIAMRFTDERNGFLLLSGKSPASRGVWATADGGASWTKRELDLSPTGLAFTPDLGRLWVVGTNPVSMLWSSGDRGGSFAPLPWSGGSPGGIAFVDAETILVPDFVGDSLYRSADGGATWVTRTFDGSYAAAHIAVSGRDVWLAGGLSFTASGARVTHSTDGGATWSTATLTDKAHSFEGGELRTVTTVSAADVWVAGANRQVFHTTNAGGDWSQVTGIPDTFGGFGGIDVRGSQVTLAGSSANGYALYVSDDSGASFRLGEQIRCPGVCGLVKGIASPRAGVLFVYGQRLLWRVERSAP